MLSALVSVSGLLLGDEEKYWLEKNNPIGVSLFARNIENKEQLKKLVAQIREVIPHDEVIIAVDQEGGRVRRLREPDFNPLVSQYVLGKLGEKAVEYHCILASQDLAAVGINMNFAPVLDIAYPNTHPVLKSRCFGSDGRKIAELGTIMLNIYIKNGICPCIKHIPGHGRAESDPHLGMPVLNHSLSELSKDFYPFMMNNQSPAGMTAHILIPEVDNQNPITMSKKAIERIIRGDIGFDGLLISDALDMKAIAGTIGEKAKKAIAAGCDVVCYCGGKIEELEDLANLCPKMSDNSLNRFEKVKNTINLEKLDLVDIKAKYYALTGDVEEYNEIYDATEVLNLMNK